MKLIVESDGDRSVGIGGDRILMDWMGLEDLDQSDRRAIIKDMRDYFATVLDDKSTHIFADDENMTLLA